jgi:hypothetical protein
VHFPLTPASRCRWWFLTDWGRSGYCPSLTTLSCRSWSHRIAFLRQSPWFY